MTDITERLKEAHALYEKAGVHGANGAGLMVDALARIEELEAARDFGIIEGDAVAHLKVVALQARVEELEGVVRWYATQLEQTKMPHSAGDMARMSLFGDCGKLARAALKETS
jgi:hypothetical protein